MYKELKLQLYYYCPVWLFNISGSGSVIASPRKSIAPMVVLVVTKQDSSLEIGLTK